MGCLPAANNRPSRSKAHPRVGELWPKRPPKGIREPPRIKPKDQTFVSRLGGTVILQKRPHMMKTPFFKMCKTLERQAPLGKIEPPRGGPGATKRQAREPTMGFSSLRHAYFTKAHQTMKHNLFENVHASRVPGPCLPKRDAGPAPHFAARPLVFKRPKRNARSENNNNCITTGKYV